MSLQLFFMLFMDVYAHLLSLAWPGLEFWVKNHQMTHVLPVNQALVTDFSLFSPTLSTFEDSRGHHWC